MTMDLPICIDLSLPAEMQSRESGERMQLKDDNVPAQEPEDLLLLPLDLMDGDGHVEEQELSPLQNVGDAKGREVEVWKNAVFEACLPKSVPSHHLVIMKPGLSNLIRSQFFH